MSSPHAPAVANSPSAELALIHEAEVTANWKNVPLLRRWAWRVQAYFVRHTDATVVIALMAAGLGVRFWINRGLWLDEATSVSQASMSFGRMLSYLRTSDMHPPLFHTILWADIRLFGTGPIAVRLPSIVIGTALVPLLYGAAREMFDRRTARIAALIGAFSPIIVWYSQETRMYPEFMAFATVALWAQVRCVRSGTVKAWLVYTVASAALVWSQYFASFFVLTQQLAFVVLIWKLRGTTGGRRLLNGWLRSALGIVLLVAPLAVITYGQVTHGSGATSVTQGDGSVPASGPLYAVISNISSVFIGYHSDAVMTKVNALWPLAMLGSLVALGRGRSRSTLLLFGVAAVPLLLLFVISFKRADVLELRYFAGAIPALSILVARAITLLGQRKMSLVVMSTILIAVLGVSLVDEQSAGANPRVYDFSSVLLQLDAGRQPGDLMLYEPFYLQPTVHYYAPHIKSHPLIEGLDSTTAPKRIFVVDSLAFSEHELSANRVQQVVQRLGHDRTLVQHIQHNHIEVWVFQ